MKSNTESGRGGILIETMYLPPVQAMAAIIRAGALFLEANEHYQKRSYRNRCHIAGPQGIQRLSIPLKGGRNTHMPIRELRISDAFDWRHRHLQALKTAYGRAPYFDFYMPELEAMIRKDHLFLFELNRTLLEWLCRSFDCEVAIRETEVFDRSPGSLDLRGKFHPGDAPALASMPTYYQVFAERNGFIPGLSALDLLFHLGPESLLYLKQLRLSDFNL